MAFLCTNCRGCDHRCPQNLSPSTALFLTKQDLIASWDLPDTAVRAIEGAKKFAERGHGPPFIRYDPSRTAFWPGCSLAGTSPEATEASRRTLEKVLGEEVGLVLDCCFDPLWQMGDTEPVKEACGRIRDRLLKAGVKRLVVGCANCKKVFDQFLSGLTVSYVIEVLPEDILSSLPGAGSIYLHHPCPFYHVKGVAERTRQLIKPSPKTDIKEQGTPACCGYGGSLASQDPELARLFTRRAVKTARDASIVTSCMGCKNLFLKNGSAVSHILEVVTGLKPKQKVVGSARKWVNRLALARGKRN
jgi:Fe-S oxidoreductase